jgi:hypothetical protein
VVAKTAIYVRESLEAAMMSLKAVINHHDKQRHAHADHRLADDTQENLEYRVRTFDSSLLRVASAEKRLMNAINLVRGQ